MLPELGKYAVPVLSAYGVSLGLIVVMIAQSLWKSAKVKRNLQQIEERRKNG